MAKAPVGLGDEETASKREKRDIAGNNNNNNNDNDNDNDNNDNEGNWEQTTYAARIEHWSCRFLASLAA